MGAAVNAGPAINSAQGEICPVLSPDGKVLFLLGSGMVKWIDASVLDSL